MGGVLPRAQPPITGRRTSFTGGRTSLRSGPLAQLARGIRHLFSFTVLYRARGSGSVPPHVDPCGGHRNMSQKIRTFVSASLILASLALGGAALAHGGHGGHAGGARWLPSLTQDQKAKLDAAAEAENKARADLRVAL